MTLDRHLQEQGLLPSTRSKYASIVAAGGDDPTEWLRQKLSKRLPIGTVLPLRAAVKHYLLSEGYDAEEIKALLPKATGDKRGDFFVIFNNENMHGVDRFGHKRF